MARFVIGVVEQLDLDSIYGYYRADGRGRPAHDPAMMVALLLYNYAVGVRSSRVIERRCVEDVACRVIAANRQPDHATIARFRVRHGRELSELFWQVLELCRDAGMVRVGTVAVDSTKLAANASLGANRSYEQLREEARRIVEEAGEVDALEDELFGERRGDELPDDLADPSRRAGRIRELLEAGKARADALEAKRAREAERVRAGKPRRSRAPRGPVSIREQRLANKRYNLTDPDSGIVRHRGMLLQGYNLQTAVGEGQVILAARATSSAPDSGQLAPTVAQAAKNLARIGLEEQMQQVLADTGYWNGPQIAELEARGLRVLVPPPRRKDRGQLAHPVVFEMQSTMAEPETKLAYRRRQQIIEPVFAHIRYHRGITRLLRRGKHAVQAEIDLIATTHNLLKLYRHAPAAA